jgi:hypothetical protein
MIFGLALFFDFGVPAMILMINCTYFLLSQDTRYSITLYEYIHYTKRFSHYFIHQTPPS